MSIEKRPKVGDSNIRHQAEEKTSQKDKNMGESGIAGARIQKRYLNKGVVNNHMLLRGTVKRGVGHGTNRLGKVGGYWCPRKEQF